MSSTATMPNVTNSIKSGGESLPGSIYWVDDKVKQDNIGLKSTIFITTAQINSTEPETDLDRTETTEEPGKEC